MKDLSPSSEFANAVLSCAFESDIISDKADVS